MLGLLQAQNSNSKLLSKMAATNTLLELINAFYRKETPLKADNADVAQKFTGSMSILEPDVRFSTSVQDDGRIIINWDAIPPSPKSSGWTEIKHEAEEAVQVPEVKDEVPPLIKSAMTAKELIQKLNQRLAVLEVGDVVYSLHSRHMTKERIVAIEEDVKANRLTFIAKFASGRSKTWTSMYHLSGVDQWEFLPESLIGHTAEETMTLYNTLLPDSVVKRLSYKDVASLLQPIHYSLGMIVYYPVSGVQWGLMGTYTVQRVYEGGIRLNNGMFLNMSSALASAIPLPIQYDGMTVAETKEFYRKLVPELTFVESPYTIGDVVMASDNHGVHFPAEVVAVTDKVKIRDLSHKPQDDEWIVNPVARLGCTILKPGELGSVWGKPFDSDTQKILRLWAKLGRLTENLLKVMHKNDLSWAVIDPKRPHIMTCPESSFGITIDCDNIRYLIDAPWSTLNLSLQ